MRMYAIVHPAVTVLCHADAISNAGQCQEKAYFYHYKGSNHMASMHDFLTYGGPIYLPIKYQNFAQSPF